MARPAAARPTLRFRTVFQLSGRDCAAWMAAAFATTADRWPALADPLSAFPLCPPAFAPGSPILISFDPLYSESSWLAEMFVSKAQRRTLQHLLEILGVRFRHRRRADKDPSHFPPTPRRWLSGLRQAMDHVVETVPLANGV